MADKLLKSIKFPTLPDRYVIGDSTLTEEGAAADAKAVGDALATKADTKGMYEDLIVGGAEQLMSDEYETDSDPYIFRPTGGSADVGNREYLDKIVGGTVAWNQLVSESATSVTVQSGHKYIAKIGGAWSVAASSGSAISVTGGSDMLIDLTALFNHTIADYIYSLEQGTAGAGVAWFRKLFPKPYYAYNAGELMSVQAASHDMVGFNAWDEEWEQGGINQTTGANTSNANAIRSKNYIRVVPNATYYVKAPIAVRGYWYDADKNYINTESLGVNTTFTVPSGSCYLRFIVGNSTTPITAYGNNICINLSWDGERDGEYEAYVKHSYALDSDLTLRGIPKLDNGNLYYDGDTYESDGTVTRKWGVVDLGTLTWGYSGGFFRTNDLNNLIKRPTTNAVKVVAISAVYDVMTWNAITNTSNKCFAVSSGSDNAIFCNTAYTDAASFKTAMSGVYLVYELATPTTETADGYEHYQICDPSGTEEFVTNSIVPVGHETRYPHDLKKKIETAPDSPSVDGTYLMKRSGGKNAYMALPSTPSANGAYVLTLTVSGGSASYSWAAKE